MYNNVVLNIQIIVLIKCQTMSIYESFMFSFLVLQNIHSPSVNIQICHVLLNAVTCGDWLTFTHLKTKKS